MYATVVYWQTRELPLLERCLESLVRQQTGETIELHVLVIDNGCGTTPRLPASGSLELLRLSTHAGFTGGHNAGMRHALAGGADYVFLVNSDLVADPACLRELVEAAEADLGAGLFGPLVLGETPADRVQSAGQAFNRWTGRHTELDRGAPATAIAGRTRSVDAASGCALLARRAVIERVGLLDDALFCYFEDMDWCLRAHRAGVGVRVVPRARVWHLGGGSTGPASLLTTYYSVRNHLVVGRRYGQPGVAWLLPVLIVGYHLAFLLKSRERRTLAHLRALVEGAVAAWRIRAPGPPGPGATARATGPAGGASPGLGR